MLVWIFALDSIYLNFHHLKLKTTFNRNKFCIMSNQYVKIGSALTQLQKHQRSAMNRFIGTHKYSWNFGYKWVNSIKIQPLWFIHIQFNIDL